MINIDCPQLHRLTSGAFLRHGTGLRSGGDQVAFGSVEGMNKHSYNLRFGDGFPDWQPICLPSRRGDTAADCWRVARATEPWLVIFRMTSAP